MTTASAPVAGAGPVVGIVGKLPAHGDFVRRGGPGAVLMLIDRWLDAELGGAVAAGIMLDDAVAALDGWRFAFTTVDGPVIAVVIASIDGVGRVFPLIATTTGTIADHDAAEMWCAAAADALAMVRDAGQGADAALAAVAGIDPPMGAGAVPVDGWWHPHNPTPRGTHLPVGDDFRSLLGERTS